MEYLTKPLAGIETIMEYLTTPLSGNGTIILSDKFAYKGCNSVFYKTRNLIIVYMDGSDPPDYLLAIPYKDILNDPLLNYNDPRISYNGKFFLSAESSWSNDILFFKDHVAIQTSEGIEIFNLDRIEEQPKYVSLGCSGFRFNVCDISGNTLTVKQVVVDDDDIDSEDIEWENGNIGYIPF